MTWASMSRALSQRASQKPSRPASKATAMRLIRCPAFAASSRQRLSSFSKAFSSTASFFNGWRSTPGTMPATSQLDRLSSITAISVPSGSRGFGDRLRSFNFCMGRSIGSHQQRWMQYPRRRPIASPLEVFVRRPWSAWRRQRGPASENLHNNSGNSSAGYPHAVGVNRGDMFHMATSSWRREAAASRRAANRFERARLQCRAPLDDGVIEQFEHQTKGRQFLLLDATVIVAFERFTDDRVDLALHRQEFLVGFRGAYPGNHGQDSVAMAGVFVPFIPIQIVTQPGAGRTEPGEKQERKPEVIAVPVEEGAFGAVDDGCRSAMHRQLGVFLGVRLGDARNARHSPGNHLTDGEQLPEKCRYSRFRQTLLRHDQMADADRLDLVIRPSRIRIEDAGWNFLGFITRV